ncbi:MAG: zinc metallopeptidase [Eggerthellaceae bacterium]|jgi:Zn-dependent membrane protease YugP
MAYLLLIVVSLIIGGGVQWYVTHQLHKYQNVPLSTGLTGAQSAQQMLDYYGIDTVPIQPGGEGEDFFDPRSNSITLDNSAYTTATITSVATACHEVGHACQFAQGYMPMRVRSALVPLVNFTQQTWMIILLVGIMLNIVGLIDLAIVFYAVAVIFSLVTLPVEFNASHRALTYMKETGIMEAEREGAWSVLVACALTYVASTLISILNLLYLLSVRDE